MSKRQAAKLELVFWLVLLLAITNGGTKPFGQLSTFNKVFAVGYFVLVVYFCLKMFFLWDSP